MKRSLRSWLLSLFSAAALFQTGTAQAGEIANSISEFSGVQGQNGWSYGYRIYGEGEPENYDPVAAFTAFPGGSNNPDPWDGTTQVWSGGAWDLNTADAAPWTYLGNEALHPNTGGEVHWVIRRWTADELAAATPIAITWKTRKENTGGGNGVTGYLYQNGVKIDSASIAGTDGTGVTRTFYVNAAAGDKFDLVLSPAGADGIQNDGQDGSFNSMVVDTTLPGVPRQPNGAIFIPAGSPDTDGDGLADFWEQVYFPGNLAAMNGTGDNDADGVTNKQEQDRGLDPTKPDTDGDGLRDGVETNTRNYVSASDTGTDPLIVDTDGDGLSDGDEVIGGTDPGLADSDFGGTDDGDEQAAGTDPADPSDD